MYMEILRKAQAQKLAEEKEEALRKLQSATQVAPFQSSLSSSLLLGEP